MFCFSADVGPPVWALPRWEAALLPADTGPAWLCPGKMAEYEPSAVQKTPLSWWRTPWRPAGSKRPGQGPIWAPQTAGHASQWGEWWGPIMNNFKWAKNCDFETYWLVRKVYTFTWHCVSFCLTVVQMDICKQTELLTAAKSRPWWVSQCVVLIHTRTSYSHRIFIYSICLLFCLNVLMGHTVGYNP